MNYRLDDYMNETSDQRKGYQGDLRYHYLYSQGGERQHRGGSLIRKPQTIIDIYHANNT